MTKLTKARVGSSFSITENLKGKRSWITQIFSLDLDNTPDPTGLWLGARGIACVKILHHQLLPLQTGAVIWLFTTCPLWPSVCLTNYLTALVASLQHQLGGSVVYSVKACTVYLYRLYMFNGKYTILVMSQCKQQQWRPAPLYGPHVAKTGHSSIETTNNSPNPEVIQHNKWLQ